MKNDSILNVAVSCFRTVKAVDNPKRVNLLTWLYSAKYSDKIKAIRSEVDAEKRKKLKLELPIILPSGVFTQRKTEAWVAPSGLMQFDIDFKDNRHIGNYHQLKKKLSKISNIAYIGQSASGNGFWGLVPITHPNQYRQHCLAFSEDLKAYGIICDNAVQNPAQARYYSYDEEPFINHFATPYKRLYKPLQTDDKTVSNATKTQRKRNDKRIRNGLFKRSSKRLCV